MKIFLLILGILLDLMGSVWFLQGINLLPGSMMSGQTQWAVIGAIVDLVGVVLIVLAIRWRKPSK